MGICRWVRGLDCGREINGYQDIFLLFRVNPPRDVSLAARIICDNRVCLMVSKNTIIEIEF